MHDSISPTRFRFQDTGTHDKFGTRLRKAKSKEPSIIEEGSAILSALKLVQIEEHCRISVVLDL